MADTYYFPNPKHTQTASPYLSESDFLEITLNPYVQLNDSSNILTGLYDEETHALLHIDPYLDLMMQSQPLTYTFTNTSPLFTAPDRFMRTDLSVSRMDGFGITQHRFDMNGNLIDTRSDSPVDYVSKSLAKQLRQLHIGGHRVHTPELPVQSLLSTTGFDAPWWTSDSIYDTDELTGVLPVYQSSLSFVTNVPETQVTDIFLTSTEIVSPNEIVSPKLGERVVETMQCEVGTQYEHAALPPRILIDAVTGTDEMERDLRNAAVSDFVDQMIDSLAVSTIADVAPAVSTNTKEDPNMVADMISCAVDGSLDTMKSTEREYEFVNAAEIVE